MRPQSIRRSSGSWQASISRARPSTRPSTTWKDCPIFGTTQTDQPMRCRKIRYRYSVPFIHAVDRPRPPHPGSPTRRPRGRTRLPSSGFCDLLYFVEYSELQRQLLLHLFPLFFFYSYFWISLLTFQHKNNNSSQTQQCLNIQLQE
jgi:hypothetical protein